MFKRAFLIASAIVCLTAFSPAHADESFDQRHEGTKPAVSGLNAKLDLGWYHADGTAPAFPGLPTPIRVNAFAAQGAVSLPLGSAFGLQVDGALSAGRQTGLGGKVDTRSAGVGAHMFWRNPDMALFGLYGHYIRSERGVLTATSWRYGAEAEIYLGRFSLEAFAGADSHTITTAGPGKARKTELAATARVALYPVENLRLDLGVEHSFRRTALAGGAEFMIDTGKAMAPSLYARASHDGKETTVLAGMKLYFGPSAKSLMARHRQDDPQVNMLGHIGALDNAAKAASPFGSPVTGGKGKPVWTPLD